MSQHRAPEPLPNADPLTILIHEAIRCAVPEALSSPLEELEERIRLDLRAELDRRSQPSRPSMDLMTVEEASDLLKVVPKTVRRWLDDGTLPRPVRLGGTVRLRRTDVERLIEADTQEAPRPEQKSRRPRKGPATRSSSTPRSEGGAR